MNTVYTNAMEIRIQNLKRSDFQDFVDMLYLTAYGDKYIPLNPTSDKGCDGILHDRIILSVYAPEKYTLEAFRKKVDGTTRVKGDFPQYRDHWADTHPGWRYVFNGEFTADMIKHVKALKEDVEPWGIKKIMDFVSSLTWSQRRKIGEYLGVDDELFVNDILAQILDDLVSESGPIEDLPPHKRPPYVEEKIEINYSNEDVDAATMQYAHCLEDFPSLENLLPGYDDEIPDLKARLLTDYLGLSGDFKTRLHHLIGDYSRKNPEDYQYRRYVTVVLVYYFEQCLIGKRTKDEI